MPEIDLTQLRKLSVKEKRLVWSRVENRIGIEPRSSDQYGVEWCRLREKFYNNGGYFSLPAADEELLSKLKDRFRGQRIFVIGNGPSLNKTALHLLRNEFTFGCNRINLLYDRIEWKPTFYTIVDRRVVGDIAGEVNALTGSIFFFDQKFRGLLREGDDVFYMSPTLQWTDPKEKYFSYDASKGVRSSNTVVGVAIQLAYHMGFDPIYLIGCDLGYKVEKSVEQEGDDRYNMGVKFDLKSTKDDDPNHFDERYFGKGRLWHAPNVRGMVEHHAQYRPAIERQGRKIFNATVGGELEEYDRVKFSSLFLSEPFTREKMAEVDETAVVAHLFSETAGDGKIMLDVGALGGGSAAHFVKMGWTTYCFEPDPKNREKLLKRFGQTPQVVIDQRAVSDKPAKDVAFFSSDESAGISGLSAFHSSHSQVATVEVTTLAHVVAERRIDQVDFLKIDVEGFDFAVLRGVPWHEIKPAVIECEYEDAKTVPLGHNSNEVAEFLVGKGYAVYVSEWHPIVRYGIRHDWKRIGKYPDVKPDPASWGNFLAFREDPSFDAIRDAFAHCLRLRTPAVPKFSLADEAIRPPVTPPELLDQQNALESLEDGKFTKKEALVTALVERIIGAPTAVPSEAASPKSSEPQAKRPEAKTAEASSDLPVASQATSVADKTKSSAVTGKAENSPDTAVPGKPLRSQPPANDPSRSPREGAKRRPSNGVEQKSEKRSRGKKRSRRAASDGTNIRGASRNSIFRTMPIGVFAVGLGIVFLAIVVAMTDRGAAKQVSGLFGPVVLLAVITAVAYDHLRRRIRVTTFRARRKSKRITARQRRKIKKVRQVARADRNSFRKRIKKLTANWKALARAIDEGRRVNLQDSSATAKAIAELQSAVVGMGQAADEGRRVNLQDSSATAKAIAELQSAVVGMGQAADEGRRANLQDSSATAKAIAELQSAVVGIGRAADDAARVRVDEVRSALEAEIEQLRRNADEARGCLQADIEAARLVTLETRGEFKAETTALNSRLEALAGCVEDEGATLRRESDEMRRKLLPKARKDAALLRERVAAGERQIAALRYPDAPSCIVFFGHHKCASRFFRFQVFERVAEMTGARVHRYTVKTPPFHYSRSDDLDLSNMDLADLGKDGRDVVLFSNATTRSLERIKQASSSWKGLRVLRDPRQVLVSNYFHHRADHAVESASLGWVWDSLVRDKPILQTLPEEDGLLHELDNISKEITEEQLLAPFDDERVLTIKLEEFAAAPDDHLIRIAAFLQVPDIAGIDLDRTSANKESGNWRNHFTSELRSVFKERYGKALIELGYERDLNW